MVVGGPVAVVLSASLLAVAASARAQSRNAIDEELQRDATGADVVMLLSPQGTIAADNRLAFVPVPTSAPGAWLCAGFAIDDRRVADARRRTGLQASVLRRVDSGFVVHASTLAGVERDDLKRTLAASRTTVVIRLDGQPYALRAEPLGSGVVVVLQRPLTEVLRPYECSGSGQNRPPFRKSMVREGPLRPAAYRTDPGQRISNSPIL